MDTMMTNTNAAMETTTMATVEPMATTVAPAQPTQAEAQVQVRTDDMVSKRFHKRELKKTKITYGVAGAVAGAGGTLLVTKGIPALFRWTKAKIEAGKIKREQAKAANANQAQPEPAPAPENGAQQNQAQANK